MDVVIVGAGAMAQVVISILATDHNVRVVGCVDIEWPDEKRLVSGVPIVGDHTVLDTLHSKGVRGAIVAVAANDIREEHFYSIQRLGYEPVNAIHASTVIGSGVSLGRGICIAEGCVLSAQTRVADNVILDAGVVVGSHADVGPNTYVGNGSVVGAGATLGRNCYLDVGVSIGRQVTVGKQNCILSGTSVRDDIADNPLVRQGQ